MAALKSLVIFCALAAPPANAQATGVSYVGSKACFGCHSAVYNSFQKTSMGRSMTPAANWKPDALPAQALIAQAGSAKRFTVLRNAAGWLQTESEPNVFAVEHQLDYAVGSGENGLTFLIRRGNYLFQAPLSYYARAKKWDLSPGYEHIDLGFDRMVPEECINCHSGRAAPVRNGFGAYANPPFQELAIGCENCHGPGAAHVKSLGQGAGTIVNPAKLTPRLAENICLNCHQGGDVRVNQPGKTYLDFRPGDWLFDTAVILKQPAQTSEEKQADLLNHHSAMEASRCFRESAGKLSCLTCHDPHEQPRLLEATAYYRAKCLTCHNEQSCPLPLKVRLAQNPSNDCAGCHMPKRSATQISHSALTNHRIPAREGELPPAVAQNEIDGVVVANQPGNRQVQLSKLVLLQGYRELAQKNAGYQPRYLSLLDELGRTQPDNTTVEAALGNRAFADGREEEAVAHLRRALPDGNPAIYLELGQALAKLGRTQDAIEFLKRGVERDPYNAVMQKTLILQYINSKSYSEARRLMEQYVAAFPEDAFMRNLLARVSQ